ncbi:alpha/beta fold hydrolase [Curtobacterium sp. RRHDQ10]|uniref:alpha/beta fold hydrolase n=1 Tax=Curtobacterium phyllosphaerae TaxID=3413379 RepID=UPI003BF0A318
MPTAPEPHPVPDPEPDEFADVPALAARLGVDDPPRPSRLTVPTRGGRSVSAVRWDAPGTAAPDTAAPVTFLHGVGIEARSFDETIVAGGTPALAIDLPGHGRSAWRSDADYSADTVAPDVLAALRSLGAPRGVLVGHSLGAIVAARIAALAPEQVAGLVLVDMSPDFTQRAVDRIVRALEVEPDHADLDAFVEHALAARLGEERGALTREARHSTRLDERGRRVRRHHFPHLPDDVHASIGRFADAWPDLTGLTVPLLLVRGDRGYVSPKLAREFADRLPDATVATVHSRHAVQTQAPVALATAIRSWRTANGL